MKKTVFIDRDGVINKIIYHKEHGILDSPSTVDQFELLPQVTDAINRLHNLGYFLVVVSNQPGLAKNNFDLDTFEQTKEKMKNELKKSDAFVDAEYYCLHHPDGVNEKYTKVCDCRKPKPGMILQAAKDHDLDIANSWMIGDGITDIQAGSAAGCKTILIGRMKCDLCNLMADEQVKPDFIAPNLYKASLIIENQVEG